MSVIATEHRPGILEKNQDLETQASFIKGPALNDTSGDRIFFSPAGDLISKGWKKSLSQDEVWRLDEENTAERIWDKLQPVWEEEKKKPKPSLFRAVLTIFKRPLLGALGVMFAYGAFSFINPIILPFLILYVNDFNVPAYAGFIYIFCIIISQIAGSVFYYYGTFRANIMGMNMRTALLLVGLV
jgi:ATP-binding cassette subfamily C (CFTR/MRP) protein 1